MLPVPMATIRETPAIPLPVSLILTGTLLFACGPSPGPAPAASTSGAALDTGPPTQVTAVSAAERAGHERMLGLLAREAERSRLDNSYVGEAPVPQLAARLASMPASSNDPLRWRVLRELSAHELRLGRNDDALAHAGEAYRMLPDLPDMPASAALQTVIAYAVAQLRVGEVRNCRTRHNADSCILPIRGGGVHVDPLPSREAVRLLQQVIEASTPDARENVTARWLMNVAFMTLGEYPDGVPARWRVPPVAFGEGGAFPRFVNVAGSLGLDTVDLAGGAVVEDFDADGHLDVMTSTSDPSGSLRLFVSDGAGGFDEATERAGLAGLTGGLNMVPADYDNDGDVDVYVLRGAWWRERGRHPNSLLRNNGDGTFVDVTFVAGLGERHFPTQTAAWGDYDLDGDVDLYVGNEHGPNCDAPGQLFRNDGNGSFTEVTERAGVANMGYAKAAVWGDYDNDRDPDLFVSNMSSANRLYRNNGDGTFTDVAGVSGVTHPLVSFPSWFWDYDNDGNLDLLVQAYGGPGTPPDVWFVAAGYLGEPHDAEVMKLYRGDGRGGFDDVSAAAGLTRPYLPMGANFGDVDNDGFDDVYLGTGYPHYEGVMPNVMLIGVEGRRFEDVTLPGGLGHLQKGHGISFADLDNDGDQDVFAQMGGMYLGDAFGNALFENPGTDNHWLALRLVGDRSNRAGIGCRIDVELDLDGSSRWVRLVAGSGGSFGANPLSRQHVGLGRASRVRTLTVRWPASGRTQTFRDLPADRYLEIRESSDAPRELPYRPAPFKR